MTIPGDFKSVGVSKSETEMLSDMYATITKLDLWDWLKSDDVPGPHGFMFTYSPNIDKITKTMQYQGHSGASFGWTMRIMELIAKDGWDAYVCSLTCSCHRAKGKTGWCGVAGGGVPACDH